MSYHEFFNYFDDYTEIDCINHDLTDAEREVSNKIQQAQSTEEITDIISDALVKSLMEQISNGAK